MNRDDSKLFDNSGSFDPKDSTSYYKADSKYHELTNAHESLHEILNITTRFGNVCMFLGKLELFSKDTPLNTHYYEMKKSALDHCRKTFESHAVVGSWAYLDNLPGRNATEQINQLHPYYINLFNSFKKFKTETGLGKEIATNIWLECAKIAFDVPEAENALQFVDDLIQFQTYLEQKIQINGRFGTLLNSIREYSSKKKPVVEDDLFSYLYDGNIVSQDPPSEESFFKAIDLIRKNKAFGEIEQNAIKFIEYHYKNSLESGQSKNAFTQAIETSVPVVNPKKKPLKYNDILPDEVLQKAGSFTIGILPSSVSTEDFFIVATNREWTNNHIGFYSADDLQHALEENTKCAIVIHAPDYDFEGLTLRNFYLLDTRCHYVLLDGPQWTVKFRIDYLIYKSGYTFDATVMELDGVEAYIYLWRLSQKPHVNLISLINKRAMPFFRDIERLRSEKKVLQLSPEAAEETTEAIREIFLWR